MGKRVKTKLGTTLAYAASKAFMCLVNSCKLSIASDINAHGVRFTDESCEARCVLWVGSKESARLLTISEFDERF